MTLVVRAAAEREIASAARYYARVAGTQLRRAFLEELDGAFLRIAEDPTAYPLVENAASVRSVRLTRFPYRVYYVAQPGAVFIIACLHMRRRPGLYRGR